MKKHNPEGGRYEVGDIVTFMWGYEQTNIDFFKIIKRLNDFVTLQPLKPTWNYDDKSMTGTTMPTDEPDLSEKVIRRKVRVSNGKEIGIAIKSYGWAQHWDGQPQHYSSYGNPTHKLLKRSDYVDWLNELDIPKDDKKSNGGRIPDNADYGKWLQRNDPIAFNVGYNEWISEYRHNPKPGKINKGRMVFCKKCGRSRITAIGSNKCPICGSSVPSSYSYNPVSIKKVASHSNWLIWIAVLGGIGYWIWKEGRPLPLGSGSHGFPPLNPVIPSYTEDYEES
jgi:hypothetical protein